MVGSDSSCSSTGGSHDLPKAAMVVSLTIRAGIVTYIHERYGMKMASANQIYLHYVRN